MVLKRPPEAGDILQGTLDMLILRTLVLGPSHGHTIAQAIERNSEKCALRSSKGHSIQHSIAWSTAAGSPRIGG